MTRPSFAEGVAVALAAALGGGALFAALAPWLGAAPALRLLAAGLGLAYVLYLLGRGERRAGRPTTLALWAAAALLLWLLPLGLPLYLLAHLGLVWLVRSLHFHAGPLAALADLALGGLALAAALWAAERTGSVALALWCLFLVQALFVAIPARPGGAPAAAAGDGGRRFERAERSAHAALRRLSLD